MEILVIIGLILLLLVLWIISVQRKFAVMDGNIQNAMNQIGVQISSRFDALFAVLDLMKGYAADDIQPLMERAAARRSVITARSAPEEVSEQEQVIEESQYGKGGRRYVGSLYDRGNRKKHPSGSRTQSTALRR